MDEALLKSLCRTTMGCVYELFQAAKLAGFSDEKIEEEIITAYEELKKQHGKL